MQPEKTEPLLLSEFQGRVLAVPEEFDLFLGGGRGGGKSYALAALALRHVAQYGERARILYLRQSYIGVADFEDRTRELFGQVYGTAARYNGSAHVWRFPGGGYLELGQLEGPADYPKFQGRSFTLLLIDEVGQWSDPAILDLLRANLRGPKGVPVRVVLAANPGGVGHQWIAGRYVFPSAPWLPFLEAKSGRSFVSAPSTYLQNTFLDQPAYRLQMEASTATDPELGRAWIHGDWAVSRGAFFASVLDEKRNAVEPWPDTFSRKGWWTYLAHDFGSSAPSVTYVCSQSPGAKGPDGKWYPRDSVVLLDEVSTNVPGSFSKGMGYTVPTLSEEIRGLAQRWEMPRADGFADDAIFAKSGSGLGSISAEFAREKVYFRPAQKADRRSGWERMRRLLLDAGQPDVPGLYISRACQGFWSTVPYLGRDPRKTDDVDSRGPDHWADAARYATQASRIVLARRDFRV